MQAKDLVQLAEQFGSPLYVYDAAKIQSQYKRLTNAFSKVEKLRINYAMKALSNVAILQLLREWILFRRCFYSRSTIRITCWIFSRSNLLHSKWCFSEEIEEVQLWEFKSILTTCRY